MPLRRYLHRRQDQRTEDNPFFLEESVQTLVETQSLVGERGAYRFVQALPSMHWLPQAEAALAQVGAVG